MKLLSRTLIILAAGALVAGALLAFGRTGIAAQMREADPRGGHFEGRGGPPPGFDSQGGERPQGTFEGRPQGQGEGRGRFEGRGGDHHGSSLDGLFEVVKNLVKIGIVVALVVLGARLLGLRRKDGPAKA